MKHGKDNTRLSFNAFSVGESTGSVSGRYSHTSTIYLNIYYCKNNKPMSSCDGCSSCVTKTCSSTYIFTDDDGGIPPPPGGDGGGGSGGGISYPPQDPCAPVNAFYRLRPNCGDTGGIGGIPLDDPCGKTKAMLEKPEVQTKIDNLKQQAQLPAVNPAGGEKGFKLKTNGTLEDAAQTGKHKVDYGDLSTSYGAYHNHTLRGTHMLSHRDLDILLSLTTHNSTTGPGNAFHGMIAAEEDGSGGYTYLNYVVRFQGTYQQAVGFNFTDDELDKIERDYEKAIDELLINPLNSDNNGITLNKEGLQKLFFAAAKLMGMENNVILQRVDDDGVKTIQLNNDGSTTAIPCP